MSKETIYRQAAINAAEESRRCNPHKEGKVARNHEYEHRHFIALLRSLPSAQPGQIHCYECKYYDTQECMGRNAFYGLKDYDYCSWAELRGERDE